MGVSNGLSAPSLPPSLPPFLTYHMVHRVEEDVHTLNVVHKGQIDKCHPYEGPRAKEPEVREGGRNVCMDGGELKA